ncbi:MAG: PhoPQ-regulated protein [Gammaproteobacteria bacterium]|nr:PhoPQ-regulated protein [Gammaproteobacteria bacterium]
MLLTNLAHAEISTPIAWENVLANYVKEPEKEGGQFLFESKQYDVENKVSIITYQFTSLTWPQKQNQVSHATWQHKLTLYWPDEIKSSQSLFFVNGGTRYPENEPHKFFATPQGFVLVAAQTHTLVVELQDIPNQYLRFQDNVPRREDAIIAYTWRRFLENPEMNLNWPLHLPMVKAVVKAMDAVQAIAKQEKVIINHFMMSGASKRGWTTWLTALVDSRVNAIVPIVIDILNTQVNLDHIYESYDQSWPEAFYDYLVEHIPEMRHTPAFTKLMKIQDPIAYLNCEQCARYRERLSIPKYIINSAGDDFFVPDSLNTYLHLLPGEKTIRIVPNQSHRIDQTILFENLLSYYQMFLDEIKRPRLDWEVGKDNKLQSVTTDAKPIVMKLWQAVNPKRRDFRLASQVTYTSKEVKGKCNLSGCKFSLEIIPPKEGFQASFAEATFQKKNGGTFVVTTPVYIIGAELQS